MNVNRVFGKQMFLTAKEQLGEHFDAATVKKLLKDHMDVCGHPTRGYHTAWVTWPEIGLDKDLYQHKSATCINEARAYAILALLEYLFPEEDA